MIEGLKPYTDTAATDLAWLPVAPAHWETRRIKTLLQEVDRRTATGEEKLLSLRMVAGLVGHNEAGGKPIPPSALVGFKSVEIGEIVMNRMRAAIGLFGVAAEPGLVSPDYAIFHAVAGVDQQYLLRLFKNPALGAIFRAESKGLGTGQSGFLRLYTDRFGAIRIPFPPLDEQRLIVRFLDWHGAMTAKLIRAKRRLIALLNEQKQSIIHRAVTRGLDPAVKVKPSGVDWLGDVPEHWDVAPLKRLVKMQSGETITAAAIDGTGPFPVYGGNGLRGYTARSTNSGEFILVGRQGALCGNVHLVVGDFFASEHAIVCHPRVAFDASWLAAVMEVMNLNQYSIAAAQPGLSVDRIAGLKVPIPSVNEQNALASAVSNETRKTKEALELAQREIALIHEFRTRLIADVVTGQRDVRKIAAGLPDIFDTDPIDDLTDEDDLDDADVLVAEDEAA